MIKIMDSKGIHDFNLPFYKIQQLCEILVNKAVENDYFANKYQTLYVNKVTKFSPEMEFCMNELGVAIPYPFAKDSYMFSSGKMHYIAPSSVIAQVGSNRRRITSPNGFPMLTDEVMGVDKTLSNPDYIKDGIIDEDSYIDTSFIKNNEEFAKLYILNELVKDENLCKDFMTNRVNYQSNLDYLIDKMGVVAVDKNENNELEFRYTEGVNPGAKDIVDFLSGENVMVDKESQGLGRAA